VKDNDGQLLLHVALCNHTSHDFIMMLFKATLEAINLQDSIRDSLLHIALCYHNLNVILMIFEAYPEAVKVQNNDGMLPRHYALKFEASPDDIQILFEAYPEAVKEKDIHGNLPHQYFLWNYEADQNVIKMVHKLYHDVVENWPLHSALTAWTFPDTIKM
jgi:hypothetical protein